MSNTTQDYVKAAVEMLTDAFEQLRSAVQLLEFLRNEQAPDSQTYRDLDARISRLDKAGEEIIAQYETMADEFDVTTSA